LASNSRGGRFAEAEAEAEDLGDGERKAASVFTVPLLSAAALTLLLLVEVVVVLLLLPFLLEEAFFFFLVDDGGADTDADC